MNLIKTNIKDVVNEKVVEGFKMVECVECGHFIAHPEDASDRVCIPCPVCGSRSCS